MHTFIHPSVDARNPVPPGIYINLVKQWDKLPTSTGERRISEPSTVWFIFLYTPED